MRWARRRHARARKQQRKNLAAFIIAARAEDWAVTQRLEELMPLTQIDRALDTGRLYESWLTRATRVRLRELEAARV